MNKDKKAIIRTTVEELIEKGNLAIVEKSFENDYVAHAGEKEYTGHAFIKRFASQLRTAIPDVCAKEIIFLAEEENTIVWQRTYTGTHKADMQRIPASGKKIKWTDMVITRFSYEKIAEEWVVSELMGELLLKAPHK